MGLLAEPTKNGKGLHLVGGSEDNTFDTCSFKENGESILDKSGALNLNNFRYSFGKGAIDWINRDFLRELTLKDELVFGRDVIVKDDFVSLAFFIQYF